MDGWTHVMSPGTLTSLPAAAVRTYTWSQNESRRGTECRNCDGSAAAIRVVFFSLALACASPRLRHLASKFCFVVTVVVVVVVSRVAAVWSWKRPVYWNGWKGEVHTGSFTRDTGDTVAQAFFDGCQTTHSPASVGSWQSTQSPLHPGPRAP